MLFLASTPKAAELQKNALAGAGGRLVVESGSLESGGLVVESGSLGSGSLVVKSVSLESGLGVSGSLESGNLEGV